MNLSINKAHYPVTVLGYGRRIGIWVQGCSIGCKNCISKDTWSHNEGNEIDIDVLLDWCREVTIKGVDGITISGGEPFEQSEALQVFLKEIREWSNSVSDDIDILCYTGLPYKIAMDDRYFNLRQYIDILITDPYVDGRETDLLRGSNNQHIVSLTDLGKSKLDVLQGSEKSIQERIQIAVDDEYIWFVGIPGKGDMQKLESLCQKRGLVFGDVSWRL